MGHGISAPAAESGDWRAQWIGVSTDPVTTTPATPLPLSRTNRWLVFRKSFPAAAPAADVLARIACDSKYWLWINGRQVVFEGQLKRGPNPMDTYFDAVSIGPYLNDGENTIAILVWYFGKHGFSHKDSGQAGLVFEAHVGDAWWLSDATWKCTIHPAFEETEEPRPNYRLPESNIRYDARRELRGWQEADYDDSTWPFAALFGLPPTAPWHRLIERPIPAWKVGDVRDYENVGEFPREGTGQTVVAKLPYNAQITPYLRINAPAGLVIDMRTDNYRGGGEPNVRAEYVTREGIQDYESPGWMNGHEVHYQIPAGVRILALKYRESGYASEFAGEFSCDDPFLNRLWEKSRRTLYLEMRDGFADCPGRERAQWWGDITLELLQAQYCLDRQSDLLSRKAIRELVDWRKADGTLYAPVPAGNWDQELPLQMLASVGKQGFWTYYFHTGDRATMAYAYPAVRKYLFDVWQLGDNDLVIERTGGWTWGDWGDNKDMPLLYNTWYSLALQGLREMALLLGHAEDAEQADARLARLQATFHRTFWTGKHYRSPSYAGATDERGHALAVISGLADPAAYPAIREVLLRQQHASPYMEKYVLEALFRIGHAQDAVDRMKRRYQRMVDSSLTTLWEGWGVGSEGFGGGSYNHAWSGGPLILLSQYVAGIRPLEPAYRSFVVSPQLAHLRFVKASVASAAGKITIEARQLADAWELGVTVPFATQAIVEVPDPWNDVVRVNGDVIWPAGVATAGETSVRPLQRAAAKVRFQIGAGQWRFVGGKTQPSAAPAAVRD